MAQAYRAPRADGGKPDLNGIWQSLNEANYDLEGHNARPAMALRPGPYGPVPAAPVLALGAAGGVPGSLGVVEGDGQIPYKPEAAAIKKENAENWIDRDPELKCYLPGVPRAMYMPYPFQIFQSTNKIEMFFEFTNASRIVHLDKVENAPADTYMGHSLGRWEGDTLIVDSKSFNDKNWFDRAGNFHSDALHLVERFTFIRPDAIRCEVPIQKRSPAMEISCRCISGWSRTCSCHTLPDFVEVPARASAKAVGETLGGKPSRSTLRGRCPGDGSSWYASYYCRLTLKWGRRGSYRSSRPTATTHGASQLHCWHGPLMSTACLTIMTWDAARETRTPIRRKSPTESSRRIPPPRRSGLWRVTVQIADEPSSRRQFRCENVDTFDRGWCGEQFRRLCHEGSGNLTGEMRLAPGLVRERVEDSKCRRPHLNGKPYGRRAFGIRET
jgi:hypothetical protein